MCDQTGKGNLQVRNIYLQYSTEKYNNVDHLDLDAASSIFVFALKSALESVRHFV